MMRTRTQEIAGPVTLRWSYQPGAYGAPGVPISGYASHDVATGHPPFDGGHEEVLPDLAAALARARALYYGQTHRTPDGQVRRTFVDVVGVTADGDVFSVRQMIGAVNESAGGPDLWPR